MEQKSNILIVEDDNDLRELIALAGQKRNYDFIKAENGKVAIEYIYNGLIPNLIILDINMPKMDGLQFCKWLREDFPLIPVIFLSARNEEYDKLIALEIGGDDYLTKPFSIAELFARISVCLRRIKSYQNVDTSSNNITKLGDIEMNKESWLCLYKSNSVILTITEFRILLKLLENPGVVFNRDNLVKTAFPDDYYNSGRSIDIHMSRIRKKMQIIDPLFDSIETVFKVGYKWTK